MNILCSPEPEREFIEAMNTLEKEKIKEIEKHNLNNKLNTDTDTDKSPNQIISFTTREQSLNVFKTNLKKTLSILEIIDYPFSQNSGKKSEIHLQGESNITDKNGETELMIEYTKKYMNTNNFGINLNENNINGNNKLNNYNFEKLIKADIFNKNNNNNNNNESVDSFSNDIIIINNDYNTSIISEINNFKNKIFSNCDCSILNKSKVKNKLNIKDNEANNYLGKKYSNNLQNSYNLSNKSNKIKNYNQQNSSKTNSINNSKQYNYYTTKNSIPFNKKSYSKDTEFSKDNINNSKKESISFINNTKEDECNGKKSDNKSKVKKRIPTGKFYKKIIIRNYKKKEKNNIYSNINDVKNNQSNYKQIIKKFNENNKAAIKSINKNILIDNSINKNKIENNKTTKKKLFLSNSSNNKNINPFYKNSITYKSFSYKKFNFDRKNSKNLYNIGSYSKKKLIKNSNNKIHLLTNIKDIFNNKKKIKSKKSNSHKIKNFQIFAGNFSTFNNSLKKQYYQNIPNKNEYNNLNVYYKNIDRNIINKSKTNMINKKSKSHINTKNKTKRNNNIESWKKINNKSDYNKNNNIQIQNFLENYQKGNSIKSTRYTNVICL